MLSLNRYARRVGLARLTRTPGTGVLVARPRALPPRARRARLPSTPSGGVRWLPIDPTR